MDTLSVFLVDLQHRWGFRGTYPNESTVCTLLMKHMGVGGPTYVMWSQDALLDILEAAIARMDRETPP